MKLQPTTGPKTAHTAFAVLVVAGQQQRDHPRAADECREGYGAHARGGHVAILAARGPPGKRRRAPAQGRPVLDAALTR